jgi:hypothetical protein
VPRKQTISRGNFEPPPVFDLAMAFAPMKRRALAGLLSAGLVAGTGWGSQTAFKDADYQTIVVRNAFGLKPIPGPTPPPPPPTAALEVFLTGISTLSGTKKVLLQVTDKAPGKTTEFLPPLVERDVQGRIEIVSIDPEKGAVVIKIDNNEKTLTFEKDAPKPGGPMPPGLPPPARPPGTVLPPPAVAAAAAPSESPGYRSVVVAGGNPAMSAGPSLPGVSPLVMGSDQRATNRSAGSVPTFPTRQRPLR